MSTKNTVATERTLKVVSKNNSFESLKVTSSQDINDFVRQFYSDDIEIYESFFLVLLNRANKTTGWVKISQGGIAGTVVDTKLVAKFAIESLSSGVILCHNHPSGNTQPSRADIEITKKIKEGLELFDITLLDHIILTKDSFYSFTDECIL